LIDDKGSSGLGFKDSSEMLKTKKAGKPLSNNGSPAFGFQIVFIQKHQFSDSSFQHPAFSDNLGNKSVG
jgi:hypothetical protein